MRLGVIMSGTGAYAAANAGVIRALEMRGIEPYAVCGMHAGAFAAAQVLCGYDSKEMERAIERAAREGSKLLRAKQSARMLLAGKAAWLSEGAGLNSLIRLQAGERLMGTCTRRGIFPCRIASSGRRVVFSSTAYAQGHDVTLTQQATIGFAARAAMSAPPFLSPMPWLGSWLIEEESFSFAAKQLLRLGVDRVLIVEPRAAMAHEPDALELAVSARRWAVEEALPDGTGILRMKMPESIGALAFERMQELAACGFEAAQEQMDDTLDAMGMTMCRILSFRERINRIGNR